MNLDAAHALATYTAGYAQLGHPHSLYGYVLEHGQPMPPGQVARFPGPGGFCFRNAGRLAQRHPARFAYCEGFALSASSVALGVHLLVHHAWVRDLRSGDVIETTWPDGGHSYYGFQFDVHCHAAALLDAGTWDVLDHLYRRHVTRSAR